MKRFAVSALTGVAMLVAAVPAGGATTRQASLCYLGCQYECYAKHPGGGPDWEQCYLSCARTRCNAL